MNLSVENLTVTGKIIFPDGTELLSSYSNLFSSFLNFERNPTLGTTTLLSDKLLISSQLEVGTEISSPHLILNGISFLNDLDQNQMPVFQSKGFSDELRQNLLVAIIKLNFITNNIIDIDQKKIIIQNPLDLSVTEIGANSFSLTDQSGNQLQAGSYQLTLSSPQGALDIHTTNFTISDNTFYRFGDANGLSTLDMIGVNNDPTNSQVTLGSENLYFNYSQNCYFNGGDTFLTQADTIAINSGTGTTEIGDVNNGANSTKLTIQDNAYTINMNAIMMTAYNNIYILPICYTKKMTGSINYVNGTNTWQNVFQENINAMPNEFFNPNNTFWNYKIEFSINLRNVSAPSDKGFALFFEILDGNSVPYLPFLYNQNTPFTRHSNNSTYSATSNDMLTFTWTDYIAFDTNVAPALLFSLWWYGDQINAPNFDALLSLTRTNLV